MDDSNDTTRRTRRRFLTAVGAGSGALIPTIGSAQSPPPLARYKKALAARKATGSNEVFREELRDQGATIATQDQEFSAPWRDPDVSSGGISTQTLDRSDCTIELTLTCLAAGVDFVVADLRWEHDVNYTVWDNEVGEQPYDIAGLSYEQRDYDLVSGSWYSGNSTSKRQYNNAGVAFNYCDACCAEYMDETGSCSPMGETFTISDYCGVRLLPDETSDPDFRSVYADYWHTYQTVTVDGVSISSAGDVSVSLSNEEKKWLAEDDINEGDARSEYSQ